MSNLPNPIRAMTAAQSKSSQPKARYIMVGGFLGAGKTTAICQLAKRFQREGVRAGLVTNDQGQQLVDTAFLRSHGFPTEEITGGCFCCRFSSLVEAAERLTAATKPDVFIAEPVGSCTDLVATVSYPLQRIYGNSFVVAPFSVLVDPIRALRILDLEEGAKFSAKVLYVYLKQLEEADIIVINKIDLINSAQKGRLTDGLKERFPRAQLFEIAARTGTGLDRWFEQLARADQGRGRTMEVDYDTYAEGEALLAWLNATIRISCENGLDGNHLLQELATAMQRQVQMDKGEIAHLKMTLTPATGLNEMAMINLVRNEVVPELSLWLHDPVTKGELIVNARAETSPEALKEAFDRALSACARPDQELQVKHFESFRPGRPVPTHRVTEAG